MGEREALEGYLGAAREIVAEAAELVRRRSAAGFEHRLKSDGSFVTDVDLEVEDLVRRRLAERFPEHGVLGEERRAVPSSSAYQWIVDPIDGTLSLRHRIPLYGTLLALSAGGMPVVGVLGLPELRRLYSAAKGLGCWRDGERLVLADLPETDAVAGEVVAVGDRRQFTAGGSEAVFDSLMQIHPTVRTYSDCFGHALALDGSVAAMVDFQLRPWDVAATRVLIREAGGSFVRVGGGEDAGGERFDVIFGKPRAVEWIVRRLTRAGALEADPEPAP